MCVIEHQYSSVQPGRPQVLSSYTLGLLFFSTWYLCVLKHSCPSDPKCPCRNGLNLVKSVFVKFALFIPRSRKWVMIKTQHWMRCGNSVGPHNLLQLATTVAFAKPHYCILKLILVSNRFLCLLFCYHFDICFNESWKC